jgi:Zn-dependent protease with chaperone function
MNTLKIVFLMTFLTVLLVAVGQATFGSRGAVMALVIAAVLNFFTYFFSDRMVLATTGARLVSEEEAPELYAVVRSLATRANVTMPRVAIIPEEAPNAFATGRDPQHAVVAATEGILKILDRDLASALRKLEAAAQRLPMDGSPANAHLFIVNPFGGGLARLFSTHPPTEERVARLEAMAKGGLRPA